MTKSVLNEKSVGWMIASKLEVIKCCSREECKHQRAGREGAVMQREQRPVTKQKQLSAILSSPSTLLPGLHIAHATPSWDIQSGGMKQ